MVQDGTNQEIIKKASKRVASLPNSRHGYESPPETFPCSLEEGTRELFRVPVCILEEPRVSSLNLCEIHFKITSNLPMPK